MAAPETGHAHTRARELWEELGSPSEFVGVPYGQSRYHEQRGELDRARRLSEDLLWLSRQRNDTAGLVLGCESCGRNLMLVCLGYPDQALARSNAAIAEARRLAHPPSLSPPSDSTLLPIDKLTANRILRILEENKLSL